MANLANENDGIRFLLCAINILSRKLWVRSLKSKTAKEVLRAMKGSTLCGKISPATKIKNAKVFSTSISDHLHQRRFRRIYLSTNPSPHDPQNLLLAQANRPMKTPGRIFSIIPSCQSD